ncbi:hypothetical protein B0H21DRAFT_441514 [Amylocystis lapponica]|nr:hypothetical protein B0H21DRAFT_441514 [Amylocystis lapponica]
MTTAPSPASEHSVYFDAPIMHIFTRKNRDSPPPPDAGPDLRTDVARQPSVSIPRDPVVRERPAADLDGSPEPPAADGSLQRPDAADRPAALSDAGDPPRPASRASQKSIPVLWTGTQAPWRSSQGQDGSARAQRAASMRSFRSATDRNSVRRRRASLSGGSFAGGAGMVGPAATVDVDDSFHRRTATADAALSEKQRSRLQKAQVKEGKQVVKVLKSEGKSEQEAMKAAIRELADIQKMQRTAIKDEAKAYAAHSKALRTFHKEELEFFASRARYERAQADLQVSQRCVCETERTNRLPVQAYEDARESTRSHSQDITEMLQDKNREVEWLRAQKVADDREREAKMRQLTG